MRTGTRYTEGLRSLLGVYLYIARMMSHVIHPDPEALNTPHSVVPRWLLLERFAGLCCPDYSSSTYLSLNKYRSGERGC